MLRQQQELAQLAAGFEATQAQSEAALALLARGDPGGHLARLQVCVIACSSLCCMRYVTLSRWNVLDAFQSTPLTHMQAHDECRQHAP